MLDITKEGRKKQELQLKAQMCIQNYFAKTEDLPNGRIRIEHGDNFVIVDLNTIKIQESSGETKLTEATQELLDRVMEQFAPVAIAKCHH